MDQLYQKAKELVQRHPQPSAIFLQKKLLIDYQRATQLLNRLRVDKVIP